MPQANQDRLRQRAQAGPQQLFPQQLQKAVPGSLQDWELRLQEEALRERLGGANPPAAGLPPGAAGLPPGAAEIQEALRAIAANNPMNPGTLPEIPALNQELQRLLGGHSPMPPPLEEMQRQELQRMVEGLRPDPPELGTLPPRHLDFMQRVRSYKIAWAVNLLRLRPYRRCKNRSYKGYWTVCYHLLPHPLLNRHREEAFKIC